MVEHNNYAVLALSLGLSFTLAWSEKKDFSPQIPCMQRLFFLLLHLEIVVFLSDFLLYAFSSQFQYLAHSQVKIRR